MTFAGGCIERPGWMADHSVVHEALLWNRKLKVGATRRPALASGLLLAVVAVLALGARAEASSSAPTKGDGAGNGDKDDADWCAVLSRKLPCDAAEGPWEHVCKASVGISCSTIEHGLQLSRHLPAHLLAFAASVASDHAGVKDPWVEGLGDAEVEGVAEHALARLLGAALGIALLLVGRCAPPWRQPRGKWVVP